MLNEENVFFSVVIVRSFVCYSVAVSIVIKAKSKDVENLLNAWRINSNYRFFPKLNVCATSQSNDTSAFNSLGIFSLVTIQEEKTRCCSNSSSTFSFHSRDANKCLVCVHAFIHADDNLTTIWFTALKTQFWGSHHSNRRNGEIHTQQLNDQPHHPCVVWRVYETWRLRKRVFTNLHLKCGIKKGFSLAHTFHRPYIYKVAGALLSLSLSHLHRIRHLLLPLVFRLGFCFNFCFVRIRYFEFSFHDRARNRFLSAQ